MSVIWSGITEEGAVVPVQVEESGKVVAVGYPGEKGDKGDPGEQGPEGPPGEYSKGDDVELNNAYFAGDVGIGEVNPRTPLDVNGKATVTDSLTIRKATLSPTLVFDNYSSSAGKASITCAKSGSMIFNTSETAQVRIDADGNLGIGLDFPQSKLDVEGDVVLKSRNKKWMIVEQSGLAHLVEQSVFLRLNPHLAVAEAAADADYDPKADSRVSEPIETVYPELRNIPGELSLVEQALESVFEKLRMSPPVGWPVWDGQSEVATGNDNA